MYDLRLLALSGPKEWVIDKYLAQCRGSLLCAVKIRLSDNSVQYRNVDINSVHTLTSSLR